MYRPLGGPRRNFNASLVRSDLPLINGWRRSVTMSSIKTQPTYRGPLISELEQAVRSGSQETRVRTLKRITDLFLGTKEKLSEEQIDVFDQVLSHLIARMESTALIELSERLAPVNNAPNNVVHTLALDDEIAVAGPVLALSDRLTSQDLVEIA